MGDTAVIFDLDGTLVDAFSDIAEAVNVPLRARGIAPHSMETIKRMVGDGAGKLLDRAAPMLPPEDQAAFRKEMLEYYYAHPADQAFVYEGIFPLLESLRAAGVPMGILTNKPHPMTVKTCEQMALTEYFQDISGIQVEGGLRKPDPRSLREQLARLGVSRGIMVGDGVPDGQVAEATGQPFVAVLWGTRGRAELEAFSPAAVAEQVGDLESILFSLLGLEDGVSPCNGAEKR